MGLASKQCLDINASVILGSKGKTARLVSIYPISFSYLCHVIYPIGGAIEVKYAISISEKQWRVSLTARLFIRNMPIRNMRLKSGKN